MTEALHVPVADALAALGRPPFEPEHLSSGWHGDGVYAVDMGAERAVLRVYRLGRERRWEDPRPLTLERLRQQADVARLMAMDGAPLQQVIAGPAPVGHGWASSLLTWIEGTSATRATHALATKVGALLASLHRIGASLNADRRPALPAHDVVAVARRSLAELAGILPDAFVADVEARLSAIRHTSPRITIHGDLNLPNIIWSEGRPSLIDLDQIGVGWASEELAWAMKWWSRPTGSGSGDYERSLSDALLDGYGTPPEPELFAPMLWLTGCTNANSVFAIRQAAAEDRQNQIDRLRRRADALEALA